MGSVKFIIFLPSLSFPRVYSPWLCLAWAGIVNQFISTLLQLLPYCPMNAPYFLPIDHSPLCLSNVYQVYSHSSQWLCPKSQNHGLLLNRNFLDLLATVSLDTWTVSLLREPAQPQRHVFFSFPLISSFPLYWGTTLPRAQLDASYGSFFFFFWAGGPRNYSQSCVTSQDGFLLILLGAFFSWPWRFSSHTCEHYYSGEALRGTLCKSLEGSVYPCILRSLCSVLFFPLWPPSIQMLVSFLVFFVFCFSSLHSYL